eukprot:scaffold204945_cov33-Tisochrysis_lutea.AAC.3
MAACAVRSSTAHTLASSAARASRPACPRPTASPTSSTSASTSSRQDGLRETICGGGSMVRAARTTADESTEHTLHRSCVRTISGRNATSACSSIELRDSPLASDAEMMASRCAALDKAAGRGAAIAPSAGSDGATAGSYPRASVRRGAPRLLELHRASQSPTGGARQRGAFLQTPCCLSARAGGAAWTACCLIGCEGELRRPLGSGVDVRLERWRPRWP